MTGPSYHPPIREFDSLDIQVLSLAHLAWAYTLYTSCLEYHYYLLGLNMMSKGSVGRA